MSLRSGSVRFARRAGRQIDIPIADLPTFLCPGIIGINRSAIVFQPQKAFQAPTPTRYLHLDHSRRLNPLPSLQAILPKLPQQCAGCGALSQTVDGGEPGFYSLTRRSVKDYLSRKSRSNISREEKIVLDSLKCLESSIEATADSRRIIGELGHTIAQTTELGKNFETPVCDRCHYLRHENAGVSIHHPSIQSIQDTIFESPYKYNHVYHIIDAADFPMSLVPGLHKLLHLTPQRSINRRSKTEKFYHGRKTEVSFIITRSDLLAPQKEHVDKMMPYLRSVLRDALGRAGRDMRLGNVRCVSAKRQWWTKELKEEIWNRGGGGWLVGKVNVGKSQLFHEVFPKGRMGESRRHKLPIAVLEHQEKSLLHDRLVAYKTDDETDLEVVSPRVESIAQSPVSSPEFESTTTAVQVPAAETSTISSVPPAESESKSITNGLQPTHSLDTQELPASTQTESATKDFTPVAAETLDTSSLLPPLPAETDYPTLPLVSALPGTTASPIRLPFGNGKGELIDLPGLSRGDLEQHVQPAHRSSLVMRSRIQPDQKVIKPNQSLLLGGFIRITPTTPDIVVLAYNFTPMKEHLTSTAKAIGIQTETGVSNVLNIAVSGTAGKVASAGTFPLKYDVTKVRTGPVTRADAAGIRVERLPFRVLATDILIEGCGWVELVAQVRKGPSEMSRDRERDGAEGWEWEEKGEEIVDPAWPEVEVFTPEGRFVGARSPMNAWLFVATKPTRGGLKARPRRAMKGMKKAEKKKARNPL